MPESIDLFNGANLEGWHGVDAVGAHTKHDWMACGGVPLDSGAPERFDIQPGSGVLVNGSTGKTANLATFDDHGDCELHIEFVVPRKSNSGVYFMGRYEIQILDSWQADTLTFSTCGGVYARWIKETAVGGAPPARNMSRPPGEWQSYDILFRAPRFDSNGAKTRNACFERVTWNGEIVHQNVDVEGPTRAAMAEDEVASGPLMLQGDHGPVAYRNIRLTHLG